MGLIFGWSYDSNTQLTSFVKSESSQSLEREISISERDAS